MHGDYGGALTGLCAGSWFTPTCVGTSWSHPRRSGVDNHQVTSPRAGAQEVASYITFIPVRLIGRTPALCRQLRFESSAGSP
jgi:hypothetical protein